MCQCRSFTVLKLKSQVRELVMSYNEEIRELSPINSKIHPFYSDYDNYGDEHRKPWSVNTRTSGSKVDCCKHLRNGLSLSKGTDGLRWETFTPVSHYGPLISGEGVGVVGSRLPITSWSYWLPLLTFLWGRRSGEPQPIKTPYTRWDQGSQRDVLI